MIKGLKPAVLLIVFVAASALVACSGGSNDVADTRPVDVPTEDDRDDGQEQDTSTTASPGDDVEAALTTCLEDAGLEITDPTDPDLPIAADQGTGPAIVNGVAGIGVRTNGAAAVFFVYDSDAEAEAAASLLGESAAGNVVVVAGAGFEVSAANDILLCIRGDDVAPSGGAGAADTAEVDACITAGGVEITHGNDPDLVVTGSGATLPVIDGIEGTGARFGGLTALFFVFESDAAASTAAQSFLVAPDVEQNAPEITVVAFQTVLFAMHPDFSQDAQVVILNCAAPL